MSYQAYTIMVVFFDDVRLVALIMSPDGIVHRVSTGQYLGKKSRKNYPY